MRLWSEFVGADFDLYVESWQNNQWKVVYQSTQSGWQDKVTFKAAPGGYYRFRAWRYTGAGCMLTLLLSLSLSVSVSLCLSLTCPSLSVSSLLRPFLAIFLCTCSP